jgi:hypothetical protein
MTIAAQSSIYQQREFRDAVQALRDYCAHHAISPSCFILCGYPKSGNTLTRFVYHNLIRVTNGAATRTVTYTELNAVNPNRGFPDGFAAAGFKGPAGIDHRGFPLMLHSHQGWAPAWREVGPTLYVHRDPLDTLIGSWYATVAFPQGGIERQPIDDFVLHYLPAWIAQYAVTSANADVVLSYEQMMADDRTVFADAFSRLGVRFDEAALTRAVEMSRFERIREMEDRHGERHGHRADPEHNRRFGLTPWRDGVRFTRSGESGQWRKELRTDTVARARAMLEAAGLSHQGSSRGSAM